MIPFEPPPLVPDDPRNWSKPPGLTSRCFEASEDAEFLAERLDRQREKEATAYWEAVE